MNNFSKKALPAAISLALGGGLLAATPASAGNFYMGAGVGAGVFNIRDSSVGDLAKQGLVNNGFTFDNSGSGATGSTEDTDIAWNVYGGYRLTNYFALEAGYIHAGSVKATVSGTVDGPEGFTGSGKLKITGIGFWGVGMLPLNPNFTVYAKLGGVRWHEQARGTATVGTFSPLTGDDSVNLYGTDFSVGAGAEMSLWRNLGVRVEWLRLNVTGGSVDVFTGGVNWQFK